MELPNFKLCGPTKRPDMIGPSTMKIARSCFRVTKAPELSAFYRTIMGMDQFESQRGLAFGYDLRQCLLELHQGDFTPYNATNLDLYWKIGITVRELDRAIAHLQHESWPVTEPRQFRDIGYLCHLRDPQGLTIELLQQGFEGKAKTARAGHPIGAQATLAHLTLRVADLAAAQSYCEDRLGMRLMSVQRVPDCGFTLYFYGWSDEPLPNPDLEAIENREWLWARPYTLLELQHLESLRAVAVPSETAAGFAGWAHEDGDGNLTYMSGPELTAFR